jgi:nitrogen PTS system EIIA component
MEDFMEENIIMTTKEVADYIKVNEKTVLKLAQYGELPAVKIGSQWRYHLTAVDQYLQKQLVEALDDDLDLIIKTKEHPIPLSRLVDERWIDLNMPASSKKKVLSQLARMAHAARLTPSYEGLYIELEEREKMLSTAVGRGVAIPHPRIPSYLLFKEPHIIIAKVKAGVDFDAPDKQKVYLFFMPCAPSEYVHVRLIAKISKLLHIPDVIERLKNSTETKDVIQILMAFEQLQILPNPDVSHMQRALEDDKEGQGKKE